MIINNESLSPDAAEMHGSMDIISNNWSVMPSMPRFPSIIGFKC